MIPITLLQWDCHQSFSILQKNSNLEQFINNRFLSRVISESSKSKYVQIFKMKFI